MNDTIADPRPQAVATDAGPQVRGWRCTACQHPSTQLVLRCPLCRGEMAEAEFASTGEVWASTCLRVRVPGHEPPFAVAYLLLDDDGPRILVHTPGDEPLKPGTRARVNELTEGGDLVAVADNEVAA